MKLIKLSETHYIVVDDSEIGEDECYVGWETNYTTEPKNRWVVYYKSTACNGNPHYKVTHSFGKELEGVINKPLSEVEEVINGYSVEKMAMSYLDRNYNLSYERTTWQKLHEKTFEAGFNAHKELMKDKLYTVEDMRKAFYADHSIFLNRTKDYHHTSFEEWFNLNFKPKTEWDVEIDEQGKLKLI